MEERGAWPGAVETCVLAGRGQGMLDLSDGAGAARGPSRTWALVHIAR